MLFVVRVLLFKVPFHQKLFLIDKKKQKKRFYKVKTVRFNSYIVNLIITNPDNLYIGNYHILYEIK